MGGSSAVTLEHRAGAVLEPALSVSFDLIRDLATTLLGSRGGLFVRFFLACVAFTLAAQIGRRLLRPVPRLWWLVATSLVLIAACSTFTIAGLLLAYALVFYAAVEYASPRALRRTAIAVLLVLQVVGAVFWLPLLSGYSPAVREFVAFSTNLTFLRAWAWAFDRRLEPAQRTLSAFALYTLFFPAFVTGPFFSPSELGDRRLAWFWADAGSARPAGAERRVALGRIGRGLVALALLGLVAWTLTPHAYRTAMEGPALRAWLHALGVYVAVYLGFSAWTDAAIGFARLCGLVLPENFDHPHRAYGTAEFWRRWNKTLGAWMHEYIYLPLGGAHPGGRRDRLAWWNVAAVFAAVALYHHIGGLKLLGHGVAAIPGFWLPWILWAILNTVGTLATRRWRPPAQFAWSDWSIVAATFAFSAIGLATAFYPLSLPIENVLRLYLALFLGYGAW